MFMNFNKQIAFVAIGMLAVIGPAPISAQGDDQTGAFGRVDNRAQRTKEFVVMGYEGILFELRSGEGAYLRTLLDLLKTNPDQRTKTIEQTRLLSRTYPNIMDFAEQVMKLHSESAEGASAVETQVLLPEGPNVYSGEKLENALNHLTRGMKITVFSKGGRQFSGRFEEYAVRRLWIKGASRRSFLIDDILAVEAPRL